MEPSLVSDPYLPTVSRREKPKLFFFFFLVFALFSKLEHSTEPAWLWLGGMWFLCGDEGDIGDGQHSGQGVGCV